MWSFRSSSVAACCLCIVGRHEPGNEANHMIDFKKSHQHMCSCACVCVGGEGEVFHITHSLANHTFHRERKGLVTLQPSSCRHDRNLM